MEDLESGEWSVGTGKIHKVWNTKENNREDRSRKTSCHSVRVIYTIENPPTQTIPSESEDIGDYETPLLLICSFVIRSFFYLACAANGLNPVSDSSWSLGAANGVTLLEPRLAGKLWAPFCCVACLGFFWLGCREAGGAGA